MIARVFGDHTQQAGSCPADRSWASLEIGSMIRLAALRRPAPRCPHCGSIIYSRRNSLCGRCGRELPDAFRFSEEESRRVVRILAVERERHRRWISKRFLEAVAVL